MSELFAKEKPKRAADLAERFALRCPCGDSGHVHLRHYERVRCSCGRAYWALRPKAGQPMQLFPWPGDLRTLAPAPENS